MLDGHFAYRETALDTITPALALAGTAILLFELTLVAARRSKDGKAKADQLRAKWAFVLMGVAAASAGALFRWLPFDLGIAGYAAAATLVLTGMAIRLWAVHTLGKFFTIDIAFAQGQQVITTGPYHYVRHPSYTGLMMEMAGLGIAMQSWASILFLMAPIILVLEHRAAVEEGFLQCRLGDNYEKFCIARKRYIPFIY